MEPALSIGQSLTVAFAIAVVLAGLHFAAPHLQKLPFVPQRATESFAGGLAVSYVFLHLLPEVATGNEAVGELLSDVIEPTPLHELGIFFVALVGFTVFYGLERLAARNSPRGGREGEPTAGVYWVHLGSFMAYNGLITYTMALRVRTGLAFALLFTVAMGLHFLLTDRTLREHYPRRFASSGRIMLAASLLAGWILSVIFAPTSTLVVEVLTALLAGSILLNVFKEEIPSNRNSRFLWFLAGLALYAGLLALVTALGA